MKKIFLVAVWIVCFTYSNAQETYDISFDKGNKSISRSNKEFVTICVAIEAKNVKSDSWKKATLSINIDATKTTLSQKDYSIDFKQKSLADLADNNCLYLKLNKDTLYEKPQQIYLQIEVKDSTGTVINDKNSGKHQLIIITVEPAFQPLSNYNYLAYIGTNFDLVEGVKAKNLFFATNIFSPPDPTILGKRGNIRGAGMYLSLYGNRAMTSVDSSSTIRRPVLNKPLSDSIYMRYTERAQVLSTKSTDNIGAYVSALIPMWQQKKPSRDLKLYYAPSLEFVWRRTYVENQYKSISIDSATTIGSIPATMVFDNPSVGSFNFNEYSFNAGILGFFIAKENEHISVRVHASVGYVGNYSPVVKGQYTNDAAKQNSDIFFTGRAWITEPISGITLQAEVTNALLYPRPFFVATLSKAIRFSDFGKFFQPITTR